MKNLNVYKNIAIIIVLFKETFELVSKTLDQIQDLNIIIIDNANNNKLKKKITSKYNIHKYILNKKNYGFSSGYNQGINLNKFDYTLVLGPDCIIEQKDINILIDKFNEYKNVSIVTPTSYDKNNNLTYAGGLLPEKSDIDKVLKLEGDVCVDSALGACMLFKTVEFRESKIYFDENFFLYFSDYDLCRRIKNSKKAIIQVYNSKCIHQHGVIKVKSKIKKIFIREYNFTHDRFYYFYKHNNHVEILNNFKKKIPNYILKIFTKSVLLKFGDAITYLSRLLAYYKFKQKHF